MWDALRNKSSQPPLNPEKPSSPFCATVGFSLESANVVGYNTVTIEKKNTILSVQFQNVSGNELSIQEAFPAQAGMTQGAAVTAADQIQVQNNAGGYDTYFLSNGLNARGQKLQNVDAGDWVHASASTVKATAKLASGQAFWYIAKDVTTPYSVNIAGQVANDASFDVEVVKKNQHIASPYPVDYPINNIVAVSGLTQGAAVTAADQIQVQNDAGGYDTYFLSNGLNARGQKLQNVDAGDWVNATASTVKATGSIPVGKGAWFIRKGDETAVIRFVRPW